jgi:hypothetical protein
MARARTRKFWREAVERAVDVDEQWYETKLPALQAAIDEGDANASPRATRLRASASN